MANTPTEPEFMGSAEIAELLGVSRQRVQQLISKPDFPAPVADLAMGKVWRTAEVRAWGVKTRRLEPDCARCGRHVPTPGPASLREWEAYGDDGILCPDCITPEERQALDEDWAETGEAIRAQGLPRA